MNIEVTKDFKEMLSAAIEQKNSKQVLELIKDWHPADIAEFFPKLDLDEQSYILSLLENEIVADILLELEEDNRKKLLQQFSPQEIAEDFVSEMDTDDAADVIGELPNDKQGEVITHLTDKEHARDIVDLLRYGEDTAGGLMKKEFIKVNKNLNVLQALRSMSKQAEEMDEVYSIFVVDDDDTLLGTLSLKKLLTTSTRTHLEEVYNDKVYFAKTNTKDIEVANLIQKYDLREIPVVDELMRLQGVITVDDILDLMKDEADEDYQLAAGITKNVGSSDNIWQLTKARLPWLLIGMFGGLGAGKIIQGYEDTLELVYGLVFFIPLIQSTAGNVGIQSSAIVVQGLANGTIKGKILKRLGKEFVLALMNGIGIASIVLVISHFIFGVNFMTSFAIIISLITVIVNAAIIGTFIPIFLDKRGIDPAVSTGPFITTSNDVLGVFIYFMIAKLILGF